MLRDSCLPIFMFSLPLQQKLLGGGKNLLLPLYREVPETPSRSFNRYSGKAGFVLIIGDFNAKSCNCSINDPSTSEGAQIKSITSLYGINNLFYNQKYFIIFLWLHRHYLHKPPQYFYGQVSIHIYILNLII